MGFWSAAAPAMTSGGISIGGTMVANYLNRQNTAEANDWQNESNDKAYAWQEMMSNSAHQREVTDLRKAGLNPILSANKGAGGGTPATAQEGPAHVESFAPAVSSALDSMRLQNETALLKGDLGLKAAQATASYAAAAREATTARQNEAHTRQLDATYDAIKSEAQTRKGQAEWDRRMQEFDNLQKRIQNGLTTINSGKDAVLGTPRGIFRNLGKQLKKDEIIVNQKTGEIKQP